MKKILVVEDDVDISHFICELLTQHGYDPQPAYTGLEALMHFNEDIDLVLLDLMLPELAGEKVLEEIRKKSDVPIIGVTAKVDKTSTVSLLKAGADDYIVKPFHNDELLARIEVQLRKVEKFAPAEEEKKILTFKDIILNKDTFTVEVKGQTIPLTKREFTILHLLMSYPKKVFTKANIYEHAWNDEFFGDDNTVNVHISNIRSKLAKANPNEEYIQTVWGIGFKMSDQ